jgi:two-component system response regulator PilR (NtrC family)
VRRLLIADDEEAIVFAMKEYFETQGYQVDVARCKDEALALLAAARYDVVIADLRMSPAGPADGLELAAAVKRLAPETRTVILTAYGSPEAREQARRVGVDAFLHKPERLKDVAAVVRGLTGPPTA